MNRFRELFGHGKVIIGMIHLPALPGYPESRGEQHAIRHATGDLHTLEQGSFDAVISRVGMIYFPDQQKALGSMKHALCDGGKVAAMVYSTAERNGFFSLPALAPAEVWSPSKSDLMPRAALPRWLATGVSTKARSAVLVPATPPALRSISKAVHWQGWTLISAGEHP